MVGFNVVGLNSSDSADVGDASGWGGLSIAYECDAPAAIELGLGDTVDRQIDYANPYVNLSATNPGECKEISFAWSEFKQPDWGIKKITIDEAVAGLAAIRFKVQGVDGKEVHFRIIAIGSKDADLIPDSYTVTFATDGGSSVVKQTVSDGRKATKPADPTKKGYTFVGWYADSTFTTPFDFNTAITANTTVYAKWKEIAKQPGTTNTDTKKAANTLKVIAKKPVIKYSKLKKKNQTLAVKKALTVSNAKGKITYKLSSAKKGKKNFKKYFKINSKNRKITVKKGLKKGTYKVKIIVKAAGNASYNAASKTVTVKIKVK